MADSAARLPTPHPSPDFGPRAGEHIGRFQVLEELAHGGMGVVYKAYDPLLQRNVAIKRLTGGGGPEEARFRIEARATAKLRHPGIVALHEVGESDGRAHLVMDYVEGQTLRARLAGPRRDLRAAARWAQEAAEAIAYAHAQGVLHRDLKPDNVLIDADGKARVTDFGLARLAGTEALTRLTASGTVLGTPAYMAPEQALGKSDEVDERTDVWGLGAVLYEGMTGKPPFAGGSVPEVLARVVRAEPTPPCRLDPRIPRDLETICVKALAQERAARYAGARDFAEDLGRWLGGEAIRARRAGWAERAWRWTRRRPGAAVLMLASLAAVASIAGFRARERASRAEQAKLAAEGIRGLQLIAGFAVQAALGVRRAGGRMDEIEREFLAPLEQAVRLAGERAPASAEPPYHLGRMYRALMRFADARREQERALTKDPAHALAHYERAVLRLLAYRERYAVAVREWWMAGSRLRPAVVLDRGGPPGRQAAQPAAGELERMDDELAELREGIETDIAVLAGTFSSAPGKAASARGLMLSVQGRLAEARGELCAALEADPTLEEVYERLADNASSLSRYGEALEWIRRGRAVDRGYLPLVEFEVHCRLASGESLRQQGTDPAEDFRAGLAASDALLSSEHHAAVARTLRAQIHGLWALHVGAAGGDPTSEHENARREADAALTARGDDREARVTRARILANWAYHKSLRDEDPERLCRAGLEDAARALSLQPNGHSAHLVSAWALVVWAQAREMRGVDARDLLERAIREAEEAIASSPHETEGFVLRAEARLILARARMARGGDPVPLLAAALADLMAVEDAGDPAVLLALGALRESWGTHVVHLGGDPGEQYAEAVRACTRAFAANPRLLAAQTKRAEVQADWATWRGERGEPVEEAFAAALDDCNAAIQADPGPAATWVLRARVWIGQGVVRRLQGRDPADCHVRAAADLEEAQRRNPRSAEAFVARGSLATERAMARAGRGQSPAEEYAAAVRDSGAALELAPWRLDARMMRIQANVNLGNDRLRGGDDPEEVYRSAIRDCDAVLAVRTDWIEVFTRRATTWQNLAVFQGRRGQDPAASYDRALADFDRVVALQPGSVRALVDRAAGHGNRTQWLRRTGDPGPSLAAALRDYDAALRLDPRSAEAYGSRGLLFRALERWPEAVADLEAAVRLRPTLAAGLAGPLEDARVKLREAGIGGGELPR